MRLTIIAAVILFASLALGQNLNVNKQTKYAPVYWDYSITDGELVYLGDRDTVTVIPGDTLISRVYEVGSEASRLQFELTGSAPKIVLTVQSAGLAVDSLFQNTYWIHMIGIGSDSCNTNTVDDSVTAVRNTSPIPLYALSRYFRFYMTAKESHSGSTLFKGGVSRW